MSMAHAALEAQRNAEEEENRRTTTVNAEFTYNAEMPLSFVPNPLNSEHT